MKKAPVVVLAGDTVVVKMYDGRTLICKILDVYNTVAGIKVKVESASLLLTVNPDQIIEVK